MNSFFRAAVFSLRPSAGLSRSLGRFYFNSGNQPSMVSSLPCQLRSKVSCCIQRSHRRFHHGTLFHQRFRAYPCVTVREFQASQPRFAGPLAIFLVKLAGPFSKLTKLAAIVGGRAFRKSWRKLSRDRRLHLSKGVSVFFGISGGFSLGFYFFHLEETPITHRTRFMPVSHKQMEELTEMEYKNLLEAFANHILPANHPDHRRVFRVARRLVMANQSKEMEHLSWQVNVVDSDEMNAFVLPNGHIFMFTGMLKVIPNEDSLATILGHEMSHAILQHAAEQVSLHGFINTFLVISLAMLWALLPTDLLAIGVQWLQNRILSILLHLPYSRKLEEEADEVGLNMAAKACFDVRESPKFWRRLAMSQNNSGPSELLKWLSTHPSHGDRAEKLELVLPKALEVRKSCRCPPLPGEATFLSYEHGQPLRRLADTACSS